MHFNFSFSFFIFLKDKFYFVFDSGSNIYPPYANPKNIILPNQNILFNMNNMIFKCFRFVLADTSLTSTKK